MTTDQPRIVAVPNVADPAAGPTPAELATGTPIDALAAVLGIAAEHAAALTATARDLATLTSAPPDTILEAFGKALHPDSTRGPGMPLRLWWSPYRAHPHDDGRPGYWLQPDRRQRHLDRTGRPPRRGETARAVVHIAPAGTPPPRPRFITRTRLAPGCHPAFMVWCITAAGDLR